MKNNGTITKEPIQVQGARTVIEGLEIEDACLAETLEQAEDKERTFRHVAGVGARVVSESQQDAQTQSLLNRISLVSEDVMSKVENASDKLLKEGRNLIDTGRLEVTQAVRQLFDTTNTESVPSKLDEVLNTFETKHKEQSAEERDEALQKQADRIIGATSDAKNEINSAINELKDAAMIDKAVEEQVAKSPMKGHRYEDQLGAKLKELGPNFGYVVDEVGTIPGVLGTKKGDHVVTMAPFPNSSTEATGVVEAKATSMSGTAALQELDGGIENRDADAGIIVFKDPEDAPTDVPFQPHGNKAIVWWDPDKEDDAALKIALMYMQMRAMAANDRHPRSDIDFNRIELLLDEARSNLTRFSTMRRHHTASKLAIDKAGEVASKMQDNFLSIVDDLCTEIASELK